MIYFIVLIFLLGGVYAYDYRKYRRGDLLLFLGMYLALVAIAGLRYRLGIDSVTYENSYEKLPTIFELFSFQFNSIRWEPGFVIFASIPRTISSDFTVFQFFHAIVLNGVVFLFIYKNTQNKFLCITLYYFCLYLNLNMEVLRESLAVCMFLLAWPFFRDGKWIYYYALSIIATFFHLSAIVTLFFPLFTIPGIREVFKLGYRTIVICLLIFGIAYMVQRKFFSLIELMSGSAALTERTQNYAQNSYGGMNFNIFGMLLSVFKNIVIPVGALYYFRYSYSREQFIEEKKRYEKLEIIIVTGVYLSVLSLIIFIIGRYNNYVALFNYIVVASCFFKPVNVRKKRYKVPLGYWIIVLLLIFTPNIRQYLNPIPSVSERMYTIYYPYSSRLTMELNPGRESAFRYFMSQRK